MVHETSAAGAPGLHTVATVRVLADSGEVRELALEVPGGVTTGRARVLSDQPLLHEGQLARIRVVQEGDVHRIVGGRRGFELITDHPVGELAGARGFRGAAESSR